MELLVGIRRGACAAGVVVLVGSSLALVSGVDASASAGTVSITPSSEVAPGSTLSVSATGVLSAADSQPFSGTVALAQCGNADSGGAPLSSIGAADCDGAAQVAHIKFATASSGTIPATSFPIREIGIGANSRTCVPVPPGTLPCQIGIGDVATAGANVSIAGTYTLAAAPPPSSTTTTTTSTTTPAATTTTPATTTTASPATRTFSCGDIPLATSALVISPNRCLTNGQVVSVSAPAGSVAAADVTAAASAFVLECNPDPAIPKDGSGCNIGGLATGTIGADGSIAPTNITIKTGQVGTSALSVCPPSQAQAGAGDVTCVIAAANGATDPDPLAAGFTVEGQTVVLPVDGNGNPTVPSGGSTTAPVATAPAQEATITIAGQTLAFTGPHAVTWWLIAIGLALLDLGYLVLSSTWTKKRSRFFRRL